MAIFVKIINNKVVEHIIADQAHINTLSDKDFYMEDDGTKLNKAGIGYTYDAVRDAFISPKPYRSWTLNETTCQWEAPVARPNDGKFYKWNEETKSWDEIVI